MQITQRHTETKLACRVVETHGHQWSPDVAPPLSFSLSLSLSVELRFHRFLEDSVLSISASW